MDDQARDAIKDMLIRRAGSNTQTRQQAEQWLIDEGLLDLEGKLRPQFGGEEGPGDQD